ncbi:MAG: Type 1 glutamine amidotransferase-like domain-containing protein [Kouleothrix sp.]|jgi:cyanophycinase-like exopeptidase|nr:Type 1 glutamine amidotransferase-like domain-containing protein [Kouleothrix sp.]
MTDRRHIQPGTIALVGSGEYLPHMREVDRALLDTLGAGALRVALLPTASGLELGMPERWNTMGAEHFRQLGAEVTPVHLVGSPDARDPQVVAALQGADMYYFSGGNPEYVIETLRDTPAWQAIYAGYLAGAVLAGCSAGAMMLGGYTLSVRSVMRGDAPRWVPALGVLPRLAVMPHFDRVADFAGQAMFRAIVASAPADLTLIGVDEDTALVRSGGSAAWQVLGRQSVSVFGHSGQRTIYRAGEAVTLAT